MHRAHHELTLRAAKEEGANLLVHPVVGMTKPGDVDHYTRVRCYQALMSHYPQNTAMLSLLPLAMRMGGPREAIWHAIIRKNHGCTHLVVGRDHAGPGKDKSGKPFYGPYDAQELLQKHEEELGMKMVDFKQMVYVPDEDKYYPVDEVPQGQEDDGHQRHRAPRSPRPRHRDPQLVLVHQVVKELRRSHPARARQGFTVFFTGLSGSGKSTIANVLLSKLLELGGRPITLLDGDLVRKNLSSELGFSKEHRNLNIKRIGYVAAEITKHRGIAVCAPIAPYDDIRKEVRAMIAAPRRLHPRARQHERRRMREARPQRPLRQGPRRHHQRIHRHQRPVRCADRRRSRHRHARSSPPKKPPRKSSCGWKKKATSAPKSNVGQFLRN